MASDLSLSVPRTIYVTHHTTVTRLVTSQLSSQHADGSLQRSCIGIYSAWCGIFTAISRAAGTTVGAGILAVPFTTQDSGFIPSTASLIGTYVFSVVTGLLLAEANINLMCELGKVGAQLNRERQLCAHSCVNSSALRTAGAIVSCKPTGVCTLSRVEFPSHQFRGRPWAQRARRLPRSSTWRCTTPSSSHARPPLSHQSAKLQAHRSQPSLLPSPDQGAFHSA